MLKETARAFYVIAGSAAGLYLTVVGVALSEENHPSPYLPTPWLYIPIAVAAAAGITGFVLTIVSHRRQGEKTDSPSTPASAPKPSSTGRVSSGPAQAPTVITRRRVSFGPFEFYGRLQLDRKISGRWAYEVSWRNGKTIGYLSAGLQNGFDAWDVYEKHLGWGADRFKAAELIESAAE